MFNHECQQHREKWRVKEKSGSKSSRKKRKDICGVGGEAEQRKGGREGQAAEERRVNGRMNKIDERLLSLPGCEWLLSKWFSKCSTPETPQWASYSP